LYKSYELQIRIFISKGNFEKFEKVLDIEENATMQEEKPDFGRGWVCASLLGVGLCLL